MAVETFLCWLVVIGRDDQRAVGAEGPGSLRPLDRRRGAVRSGAGQYRHSSRRRLDSGSDDAIPFGRREGRGLTGRSARYEPGDTPIDLPLDERPQGELV